MSKRLINQIQKVLQKNEIQSIKIMINKLIDQKANVRFKSFEIGNSLKQVAETLKNLAQICYCNF